MCDPKECITTAWGSNFWDLLYFACVVVIHSSLGQRLIRHEWEMSLPDMGLRKCFRTKTQRHFQRGQYLIGDRDEKPPTKRRLLGFKGKPPPSPFVGSCVTRRSALPQYALALVVHSSLGQRLIRHEWETSLPDVGLSKSLRTKAQRHFQRGQYLSRERFVPPKKGTMQNFKRNISIW